MEYDKDDFMEMIRDWQLDNSPRYDDLEIEEATFDEDTKEWSAVANDDDTMYLLADNGRGNIAINYLGNR